jgi:CRP-like cAMP-binding protein
MVIATDLFGRTIAKGRIIFRQGDPGDEMYIIQSGAVEVSKIRQGRKIILTLLEKGDFFGEVALIDSKPRSATVTALTRTRLLVATQFNNAFINLLITDLAQRHSQGGQITPKGSRLIGRCIRLLDPCLSCATH